MNFEKVIIGISIIIIIVLLIFQQIAIRKNINKETPNVELAIKELSNKIDSLSNIRDSLIIRVDSNKIKIIELEKVYEKTRDSIVTQSVDSDCLYFSKYVSNYWSGLSSNNNP